MNARDLGPLADDVDASAEARLAERVELFRRAAISALMLHQQIGHLDAVSLAAAKHWANYPPLGRQMSAGDSP